MSRTPLVRSRRPWFIAWIHATFVGKQLVPRPIRLFWSIVTLILAVLAIVGLPRQVGQIVDDIAAWGGVFATVAGGIRATGDVLGSVVAGPIGQWAVVIGSAVFLVWVNLGRRGAKDAPPPPIDETSSAARPAPEPGPNDIPIQEAIVEDRVDRAASTAEDLPFHDAIEVEGYPTERMAQLAEGHSTEPPADWTGAFWKGRQIIRCPWDDDFRTTSNDRWIAHQDTHTEPPTPGDRDAVTRVPMPWAKVPLRFLGDGSQYVPGVPADPDHTLYATEDRAAQIEATGLYERGVVPKEDHGLGAVGRHLVCKCGHEAATTPEFQSHLHKNGIP